MIIFIQRITERTNTITYLRKNKVIPNGRGGKKEIIST